MAWSLGEKILQKGFNGFCLFGVRMAKVAVILADGFEEIEAVTVIDVLRRCGVSVDVIGLSRGCTEGAHGIKIIPDMHINDVYPEKYDAVVLPGGDPGYINLRENSRVIEMIRDLHEKGRLIAAICASPSVLSDAGILKGKKATIYPGMEEEVRKGGGSFREDPVVVDGNIVTSRGPATALLFALRLAEVLVGKEKSMEVGKALLKDMVIKEV